MRFARKPTVMAHRRQPPTTEVAAIVLGVVMVLTMAGCSSDHRRTVDSASDVAGSAAGRAADVATRLKGPAAAASNSMTTRLQDARSDLPAAARSLADNARCVGDGTVGVLGVDLVDEFRAAGGVVEGAELSGAKADELQSALGSCVDIETILVSTMTTAGPSDAKARCVAQRAVNDDALAGPFLVGLVFGDPGLVAAMTIAVRAGAPCLDDADLDLLVPFR